MVTVLNKKHLRYDPDGRDVVIARISVTSASELPSATGIDGLRLHEASGAWDISTGDTYGFTDNGSGGTWNKQKDRINVDWLGGY